MLLPIYHNELTDHEAKGLDHVIKRGFVEEIKLLEMLIIAMNLLRRQNQPKI